MIELQKKKRITDKDLLKVVKEKPCKISNSQCYGPIDPHHIKTRGSGGNDTLDNLYALCRYHHTEIHKIGVKTFVRKYLNDKN